MSKVIFIVDDDPQDLEMLCEAIHDVDASSHTQTFQTGKEVLSKLTTCQDEELPVILILDFSMPEFTGLHVLREMANHPRFVGMTKYIFSTSGASRYKQECLKVGADAYFVKPNSLTELRTIVKKMLAREHSAF